MSIDNNAIVNSTCDNISHIYNSVNTAIGEYNDDSQILKNKDLTDPSNVFPSSVINNVPNGVNTGQFPIWENSTSSYTLSGFPSIRLGSFAGFTGQESNSIAIGSNSGRHFLKTLAIAIGWNAGRTHCSTSAIAIGSQAGELTQGQNSISIGRFSGQVEQREEAIAIGRTAGQNNQGTNSIAIGSYAGQSSQPQNSIIINASGNPLNTTLSNSLFIDPIRNTTTGSNIMCYDTSSKEISYVSSINPTNINSTTITSTNINSTTITSTNITASNLTTNNQIIVPLGSLTNCSVQFSGDPNTGIFSSGSDNIDIVSGGVSRFNINNTRAFINQQIQAATGSSSAPTYSFGGNNNSGMFSGGSSSNTIKISTNSVERLSVDTQAFTYSLPIKLQTTGGTASNLDFYQEYTHNVGWNFGSTNSNVQVGNVRYVRIGKIVTMTITYDWTAALTMNDVGGGTAIMATATLSVMRPSQTISFLGFAQVNGANTTIRVLQNTSGTTEITPLAGGNFAQNTTLRLWTNSFTYALT